MSKKQIKKIDVDQDIVKPIKKKNKHILLKVLLVIIIVIILFFSYSFICLPLAICPFLYAFIIIID